MSKLKTKDDLLKKLRNYATVPDDDNIVYKEKIKNALIKCPELLYALHEKDLEEELFDEDGNINMDENGEPLGEWDRYFGDNANIRPYLFIPQTQTDVKHFLCYQVSFENVPRGHNIQKYTLISFTAIINGSDAVDSLTGIARHDLIASIIRERFNWSSIFGFQTKLVSSSEKLTDNNYLTRTLIFQITDTNSIAYTPFDEGTMIRNTDYWK